MQQEGSYALRYRIFNIFCKSPGLDSTRPRIPILASCYGGVFKIWSTKSFPGLAPSTELTKASARPSLPTLPLSGAL